MTATLDKPVKAPTFRGVGTRRRITDVTATVLVTLAVLIALIPLVWVLFTAIAKGIPALTSATWFTHSLSGLTSSAAGGGVYHALIGTILQGLVCALLSIPLGLFVAIYLVEYADRQSRLAKLTTFMVDILSGVPSIVAALFIYALWIATFGFPKSGFAVSLALVLLMVPVVIRSTEEMLRIVPQDLREASYALGVPKWKTIARIVLPTALPGIITGVMLALARVMGETAPLLILVGYAPFINFDLFGGEMGTLPGVMVSEMNNPTDAGTNRIWGAALTLILLIAILNVLAKVIGHFSQVRSK
ncbi:MULTISPECIES: phosphate ABC transporter permease PstA [Rhodococcus]|jgi:phosphate transport system permease protein|uniref:Phosphate transport system permease protein PstA n=1 Tax=Rhodococcus oxybenzonivorans TaxID=1990687 RepID=A0A2S2BRF1_9NOCA|nr:MULTISPECIES: phosphate ABC transporter permease PstA [Rhodococcus]AWK71206.1 phosphate ABC transporter, permease protein PstA [Rhodococcus oxybenzonivorans]MDV7240850.1 phosphate ABC transporter permease PstA [Rhodococcus oxybenzonivorans]MDV7267378.1 phosphate ABC transporter permease PstA [Rhodococcus oxybenzonivorans]MDV7273123.1 phosphate ABC transporter permease PstA [Rhodococcus oxybenzonivorans]MDV7333139.1 phosphate ABC transporter permease PstA [Rhodococcus oxybenzonivorans]